jgi:putative flippase GtrA
MKKFLNKSFLKFLIGGILNTGLCYFIYYILIKINVNFVLALTIEYMVGIGIGFYINRTWVFNLIKYKILTSFLLYLLIYIGIFIFNLISLIYLINEKNFEPIIGQLIIIILITPVNYFVQKKLVFSKPIN